MTLGFSGGKGVATAFGTLLVLCPFAAAGAAVVFGLVLARYRYVSLASVLGALAAPLAVELIGCPAAYVAATVAMSAVIAFRHTGNLRRLLAGSEPRLELHRKQAPPRK